MSTSIQRGSGVPLYLQISEILKRRILNSEWARDATLPAESDLCSEFEVARGTVRQALSKLEREGYVQRERGRGTTVVWGSSNRLAGIERSRQIGFVVPYVRDSFVSTILLGVEEAATEQGYSVTFKRADNDPDRQLEVLETLFAQNLAGIVVYPVDSNHVEPVLHLMEANYPVVLVDRYLRGVPTDYVISDHFGGALRATQHLIRLGHRRIGFVSWSDPSISIEHRAMGYRSALSEAGIPYQPERTAEVASYPRIDVDRLCDFLSGPDCPTAIFAANDQIALATYDAARRLGVRIPEDLALVGFDNLDITSHLDVPLTTVMQPAYDMGHVAVETLLKRIRGEAPGWQQIILPTSLIVRRSCGVHLARKASPSGE